MDLSKEWYRKEALVSEEEQTHRTTNEENNFFQAVCNGDINAVRKNCEESVFRLPTVSEFFRAIPSQI